MLAALWVIQLGYSAEMRVWMSRKGGTLDAELGEVHGDMVSLINRDSKEIKLSIEDLSLADRQHLVEFGGAPETIITSGKPGLVEKEVRIDTSSFKRLDTKLKFPNGPSEGIELLETPHFLVATAGKIRPQGVAETAERIWHGMAFQHMNFRRDWENKRMLILLLEDQKVYQDVGKWYAERAADAGEMDAAMEIKNTWNESGSNAISLTDEMAAEHHIFPSALIFQVKEDSQFRKSLSPFIVHSLAGRLLAEQLGGVSSFGDEGYFAIITGHAYFKEISLGGKSETVLLAVEGTLKDEISSKSGFDDGSSWARSLRTLVRSGKVPVELAPMLKWKAEELTPERLVLIYSFAYYMQSDLKRLADFAKLVRRVESSNQIPDPDEIARIFGFDSAEKLEADWAEFIKSGSFK